MLTIFNVKTLDRYALFKPLLAPIFHAIPILSRTILGFRKIDEINPAKQIIQQDGTLIRPCPIALKFDMKNDTLQYRT